jgi:hypothetical protein
MAKLTFAVVCVPLTVIISPIRRRDRRDPDRLHSRGVGRKHRHRKGGVAGG